MSMKRFLISGVVGIAMACASAVSAAIPEPPGLLIFKTESTLDQIFTVADDVAVVPAADVADLHLVADRLAVLAETPVSAPFIALTHVASLGVDHTLVGIAAS